MKKLTLEEVKQRVKLLNPNIEIVSSEYKRNCIPLKCKCLKCGYEWFSSASNLMCGKGCKSCKGLLSQDIELVKKKLAEVNPNIEILNTEYKNNKSPLLVRCKVCGDVYKNIWSRLKLGVKCGKCEGNKKLTLEEVKDRIKKISPNIEILSTEYINSISKLDCKCLNCGYIWQVTYGKLSVGRGCPKCAKKAKPSIEEIENINPNIEVLADGYKNVKTKLKCVCKRCGHEWTACYNKLQQGRECPKCAKRISRPEVSLADFVKSIANEQVLTNTRDIITPYELDIYVPNKKISFEFNGLFWHNSDMIDKNAHINKTKMCEVKGIKLMQIFESEWYKKQDICKSMIRNSLGNSFKIYARDTECLPINSITAQGFLKNNHIQGSIKASVNLALFYNGDIVSIMSFGKSRFNKKYEWEILRFCHKLNTNVVGGASKLLKNFERIYSPKNIISYGNRRWCSKLYNVYETLGFQLIGETEPAYYYFLKHEFKLYNRLLFQKHKLKDKLKIYDENKTEKENMRANKYLMIYDCGNLAYCKNF